MSVQRSTIKPINDNAPEPSTLSDITCAGLWDICRVHGLLVSGRKDDLVSRLMPFIEALSTFDGENSNEHFEGFESDSR